MNIRQAILAAADHIEANPKLFKFSETNIPQECRTPGCALGWIGHFAGVQPVRDFPTYNGISLVADITESVFKPLLGIRAIDFYDGMDTASGVSHSNWRWSAPECARVMRLWADAHYPVGAPKASGGLPESILAIFREPARSIS